MRYWFKQLAISVAAVVLMLLVWLVGLIGAVIANLIARAVYHTFGVSWDPWS